MPDPLGLGPGPDAPKENKAAVPGLESVSTDYRDVSGISGFNVQNHILQSDKESSPGIALQTVGDMYLNAYVHMQLFSKTCSHNVDAKLLQYYKEVERNISANQKETVDGSNTLTVNSDYNLTVVGQLLMLMVIAVMGVMAAVAIPAYTNYLARARAIDPTLQDALMSDDALDLTGQLPSPSGKSGFISGETAPWTMRIPSPSWQPLPQAQAKQQNPLADGWIIRNDIDAHIMVIAEKAEEMHTVTATLPIIIDNAKRAGSDYELIAQTPIATPGGDGVLLHSKSRIDDYDLEYLTGVRLMGGYLFQIVCFAETKAFADVRPELMAAIRVVPIVASSNLGGATQSVVHNGLPLPN